MSAETCEQDVSPHSHESSFNTLECDRVACGYWYETITLLG